MQEIVIQSDEFYNQLFAVMQHGDVWCTPWPIFANFHFFFCYSRYFLRWFQKLNLIMAVAPGFWVIKIMYFMAYLLSYFYNLKTKCHCQKTTAFLKSEYIKKYSEWRKTKEKTKISKYRSRTVECSVSTAHGPIYQLHFSSSFCVNKTFVMIIF